MYRLNVHCGENLKHHDHIGLNCYLPIDQHSPTEDEPMLSTYKKTINQGLESYNPGGVSAIEITGAIEGLILKQNFAGKESIILVDNRSAGALIEAIKDAFFANVRGAYKGFEKPSVK